MSWPAIHFWRRISKTNDSHAIVHAKVEPRDFDYTKPLFLCLSGNATATEPLAGWFARIVETMLGGPTVYDSGLQLITAQYVEPEEYDAPHYAEYLMEKIFSRDDVIPQLQSLDSEERRKALEHCRAILSNINVVAYSLGTRIMPLIHESMRELMFRRGFTEQEGAQARRCVHVLCFGDTGFQLQGTLQSTKDTESKPWDFTSVHFISTRDKIACKTLCLPSSLIPTQAIRDSILRFGKEDNVLLFLGCLPDNVLGMRKTKNDAIRIVPRKADEEGHDEINYTGMRTDMGVLKGEPYVSEKGGQWLMPAALWSAVRQCLFTSLHGNRGNPAALLQSGKILPSEAGFYAAHEGFGYQERIQELLQQSIHFDTIPFTSQGKLSRNAGNIQPEGLSER